MASLGYAPDYDRDAAMELYPFLADVPADNYIDAGGYEAISHRPLPEHCRHGLRRRP